MVFNSVIGSIGILLAGSLCAADNLFQNGSFEEWCEKENSPTSPSTLWRVAKLKDDYGRPIFGALGRSEDAAHSGRYSLHIKDVIGGPSDGSYIRRLTKSEMAPFRGKGLRFSAWVKLDHKSSSVKVGIAAKCSGKKSPTTVAEGHLPPKVLKTDEFRQLVCCLKVPEDVESIELRFDCARGYWGVAEAYFDDCELVVIPQEAVPEDSEAKARRLRKPFVPNKAAQEWAAEWCRGKVFEEDGRERPRIEGGNFVRANGKFFYPVGPWIYPTTKGEWDADRVKIQGVDHLAYTTPPSKRVFDAVGVTTAQMSGAPRVLAAAACGYTKDIERAKREIEQLKSYYKGFEDMPMTVDFAFGPTREAKAVNPELFEQASQVRKGWHNFIPFCPESSDGDAYYRAYFETGVKLSLELGLNVGIWELFNESVYGCECKENKIGFCRQAAKRYGGIDVANRFWGTAFSSFADLENTSEWDKFIGLRVEWYSFLASRYAQVLAKYRDFIRTFDHRKNVYFTEQLDGKQMWDGVMDYRKIADELDILAVEGGWSYGGGTDSIKTTNEMEAVVFSGPEIWYTLDWFSAVTRGKKPIVNDEHYCTRYLDGKRAPSRATDLVTSLWLEFFHGSAGTIVYVWDKRGKEWNTLEEAKANVLYPCYKSSSMLNPYNWPPSELDAFKRFRNELAPWQERISAFPRTIPPSVAIYHSQVSSAIQPQSVKMPLLCAYKAVLHALYPVTFVFDDDLTEGKVPAGVQAIVVPSATYETDAVCRALARFARDGGLVIVDQQAFSHDEHGRKASRTVERAVRYDSTRRSGAAVLNALEKAKVRKTAELIPLDGKGAFLRADVQMIDRGDLKLVLCVDNTPGADENPRPARLSLSVAGDGWRVKEVVGGRAINPPGGAPAWTSADLKRGIDIRLPRQERFLISLER